ncbi:MAG: PHP domain-containing protein [Halobacteriota archaeon]|nr:PHP domain-containing protein [Halobacteriota archaeon]
MVKVDLHVHSNYSDGRDSVEKLIVAAKEKNMDLIAIVDHGPGHIFGIKPEEMKNRKNEIIEYSDMYEMDVRVGIELDLDICKTDDLKLWDDSFDLILGSFHKRCTYEDYFYAVKRSIESIDVLAHHGLTIDDYNDEIELELIALLRKFDVAVELNSRRGLPWPSFIRLCADAGLKYAIGSDAHRAMSVGRVEWAENIAKEYFDEGDMYLGR